MKIQKLLNFRFLLLFTISVACLLFMHWQLALTIEFEYPFKIDAIFSNLISCFIDVTFFFLLSLLFTKGRVKQSLLVAFIISLILSFCNILYSRFFYHYMPTLAILQIGNMYDGQVVQSMLSGFRMLDLCYIAFAFMFGWLYVRFDSLSLKLKSLRTLGVVWGALLGSAAIFIMVLALFHDPSLEISFMRFSPIRIQYTQAPNNMTFRSGIVRRVIMCYEDLLQKDLRLDKEQIAEIEQEYMDYSRRTVSASTVRDSMNLIFIIVESYLSITSDLVVDGKEITPFLNQLKRDSSVFYNGKVQSNIEMGQSSDGQFIYMSGLLPLKTEITVNIAKNKKLCGLAEALVKDGRMKRSHIVVPTSPTFWEQDAMNPLYGIETMYSKFDCDKALHGTEDLNDEQTFSMASSIDTKSEQPFFSLILTMSMHSPYNKCVDHSFKITDKDLTQEYRNYLVACNYFDMQIEKYIKSLIQKGVYENSVIVITADHPASPMYLNMEGCISEDIPLYIVHGGIDAEKAWTGSCNQLDIYTTLLDMFGVESKWRGMGQSLLNPNYTNSVSEKTKMLSERIIRSDYFRLKSE